MLLITEAAGRHFPQSGSHEAAGRKVGLENGDLVEELEVREFGRDVDGICFKDGARLDKAC